MKTIAYLRTNLTPANGTSIDFVNQYKSLSPEDKADLKRYAIAEAALSGITFDDEVERA